MKTILAAIAALSLASAQPRITSAYTKLDLDRCQIIESVPSEDWESRRCPGYEGIPVFWNYGDVRDDIDVGVQNDAGIIAGPPHGLGQTLEWRLADGKPFAIIYRVDTSPYNDDWPNGRWSRLIVETIGKPGAPGCPVAIFDGLKPKANLVARQAADAVLAGKARCIDINE